MKQTEFQVGAITTTHGIRGEVKVFPTTDEPEKFKKLKKVTLRKDKLEQVMEIESAKFFKNLVILKFKGYDNINDVERFAKATLWIGREDAVPLEEGEYYRGDLVDMEVFDENGTKLGILTDIMETGANDVYVVTREGAKELLLPSIPECILDVDVDGNKMTVHVLDGLFDL